MPENKLKVQNYQNSFKFYQKKNCHNKQAICATQLTNKPGNDYETFLKRDFR